MSLRATLSATFLFLLSACPMEGGPCKSTDDCQKGRACCDGKCVDTGNDRKNCGACGAVCAFDNVVPSCKVGRCQFQCQAGFGNCNDQREDGCEEPTASSPVNCGVCGRACTSINAASVCQTSLCGLGPCNTGFADCDQDSANGCEVDTRDDVANCAGCGQQCSLPNASSRCAASTCEVDGCDAGFGNCDLASANGCEAPLSSDALNCGQCGLVCGPQQYCAGARCRAAELIIFGGQVSFTASTTTAEVYRFNLDTNTFSALNAASPDGSPSGRSGHVATFDFPRNRMLLWGGIDGAGTLSSTQTWALDFTVVPPAWRRVATVGTPPSARFGMAAAQDQANSKWYLYGGSTDLGEGLSELFTFELATNTWAQVHGRSAANAPGNRVNAVAAFDPVAREFQLFGGNTATGADLRELWRFNVSTRAWQLSAPTGPIARAKGAFFDGSPSYLFSGITSLLIPPASMVEDLWALDVRAATTWSVVNAPDGPGGRFSASSTARDGKLYVFAGGATTGVMQSVFTDVWVGDPLALTWTRLNEGLAVVPTGKLSATLVAR